jgi:glycosyltransferase involved in cell wall biosynthesis
MEKGTIIYIGGFELPDKNAAAHRVIANAKILKSLGYSIIFIGVDKNLKNNDNFFSTKYVFEGFDIYSVKYPSKINEWLDFLGSIKFIKKLEGNKPKAIIAYNYPGFALLKLNNYCKKKGIKLIGDCSEWYEPKGNLIFRIIKSLDVFIRMKIVQPKMDGLIVISDYLESYYKKKKLPILNIPPLVDLNMNKWKIQKEMPNSLLHLVYAGSPGIGNKDRLDKIICILSEIKQKSLLDFKLNIIGLSKEQYLYIFGHQKFPFNGDDFLSFKGRLSHLETLIQVSNAHFFIFIRDNNLVNTAGFPTKFVESISAGTPVLTNSSSNIKSYLKESKNGFLLDTFDENKLKEQLFKILQKDHSEILEMKNFCKHSGLFDVSKFTKKFDTFLNSVF